MVRVSESSWMKFTSGLRHASTVINREGIGLSYWSIPAPSSPTSVSSLLSNPESTWFRVTFIGMSGTVETIFFLLDGTDITKIRMGYLANATNIEVGLLAAAAPNTIVGEGGGGDFEVVSSDVTMVP
jgi:regulation of enolase protein 1 (concanavalin A-like superfamily)